LRAALLARAMLFRLRILWFNLIALAGATAALVPLLARRRPLGARRKVPQPRFVALPEQRRAVRR
jgi:hypothetical protein